MRVDLDTGFPEISGNAQQDLRSVLNYLFMLREQLDYLTGHLETDNFSEAGLKELGTLITQPLTVQLEGAEDQLLQLRLWQEGLTLQVENGEHSSTVSLKAGEAVISSQKIELTGMVTFSALETTGETTINGDNITTGTLKSITTKALLDGEGNCGGQMLLCYRDYDTVAAGILLDDAGAGTDEENRYRMILYTDKVGEERFAMKLMAAGCLSMDSGESVYIRAGTNVQITAGDELSGMGEIRLYGKVYVNNQLIS